MKQSKFLTYFTHKHKLSMRRVLSGDEVWHIFTSRGKIFILSLLLLSVISGGIFLLILYTPIVDKLPGNIGSEQRELLVTSIMRIDSLEKEVIMWENYSEELQMVLEGRITTANITSVSDSVISKQQSGIVSRSPLDSIIRESYLAQNKELENNNFSKKSISFEMIAPISGIITERFNPKKNQYGVTLNARPNSVVLSVLDGTVIINSWNPQEGYIVGVQHSSSIITFYKGLQKSIKSTGSTVRAGEGLGISEIIENGNQPTFVFEMWSSGNAVDPENFINF